MPIVGGRTIKRPASSITGGAVVGTVSCGLAVVTMTTAMIVFAQATAMSGELYWFYRALNRIKVTGEDAISVSVVVSGKDSTAVFAVKKSEVESRRAKRDGVLRAVRFYIALMRDAENSTKVSDAKERLTALTGQKFSTVEEWGNWLNRNERFLYYAESDRRLHVDEAAKRDGVDPLGTTGDPVRR